MVFKVFFDANVILDLLLKRGTDYEPARKLFELVLSRDIRGYTTPAVFHIVSYWLTKDMGKQKSRELLLYFVTEITVIEMSHEMVLSALYSKIDDVEDALQYFASLHHNLDVFLTRDKSLKKYSTAALPMYTPIEFLRDVYVP